MIKFPGFFHGQAILVKKNRSPKFRRKKISGTRQTAKNSKTRRRGRRSKKTTFSKMAEIFSVDRGATPLNSSFFSFSKNQFFWEIFTGKVDPRNKELTTEKCFFEIKYFFTAKSPLVASSYLYRRYPSIYSTQPKKKISWFPLVSINFRNFCEVLSSI